VPKARGLPPGTIARPRPGTEAKGALVFSISITEPEKGKSSGWGPATVGALIVYAMGGAAPHASDGAHNRRDTCPGWRA